MSNFRFIKLDEELQQCWQQFVFQPQIFQPKAMTHQVQRELGHIVIQGREAHESSLLQGHDFHVQKVTSNEENDLMICGTKF